jgi:hypothetical protein
MRLFVSLPRDHRPAGSRSKTVYGGPSLDGPLEWPCHPGAGGRAVDESKAAPFCCRCCRCCRIKGTERRFRRAHAPTEQVKRRKACTSREAEFLRMSTYRKDQPLPKTNFDLLVHKMLGAENQILFMLLIRIYYIAHTIRGSCVSLCAYLVFYLSACCNIRNI